MKTSNPKDPSPEHTLEAATEVVSCTRAEHKAGIARGGEVQILPATPAALCH